MLALLWRFLKTVALPGSLVLLAVHLFVPEPRDSSPQAALDRALKARNYSLAKDLYRRALERDPFDLESHRGYLNSHFALAEILRNDRMVREYYENLAAGDNGALADVGRYGLGYFYSLKRDYANAETHLLSVVNPDLPYRNNSLGFIYKEQGRFAEAEARFGREIEIGLAPGFAYSNLASMYFTRKDWAPLARLLQDPAVFPHVSSFIVRVTLLREWRWWDYVRYGNPFSGVTRAGVAASVAIFFVWFGFLRRVDIFEPEQAHHLYAAIAGGALAALIAPAGYDLVDLILRYQVNGSALGDLGYSLLVIGPLEELVKIIPPLLILKFTHAMDETVDYVVYGAASGLGFATIENLTYLSGDGTAGIFARSITAALLHMSFTAYVMYGLLLAAGKSGPHPALSLLRKFAGAAILHGLYDFGLFQPALLGGTLRYLSFAIAFLVILAFSIMLRNALSRSEHFRPSSLRVIHNTSYLVRWLAYILLLQYVLMAVAYGPAAANRDLLFQLMFNWLFLVCVLGLLGRLELSRKERAQAAR